MYTLENYQEDKKFEALLLAHYEDPSRNLVRLLFQQLEKLSGPRKEIVEILENEKKE